MVNKYLDKQGAAAIVTGILGRLSTMDSEWANIVETLNTRITNATEIMFGKKVNSDFYEGTYASDSWTYSSTAITPNTHTIYIDVYDDRNDIYRWESTGFKTLPAQIPLATVEGWFE